MFAAINLGLSGVGLTIKGENMKTNEEIYNDFRKSVAKLFGMKGADNENNN